MKLSLILNTQKWYNFMLINLYMFLWKSLNKLIKTIYYMLKIKSLGIGKKIKKMHLPGFEPGTSRVWGERDNQLHHKCNGADLTYLFLKYPYKLNLMLISSVTSIHFFINYFSFIHLKQRLVRLIDIYHEYLSFLYQKISLGCSWNEFACLC